MPYAEGQDLSVQYADCSPLEQTFRDTEAMRALAEMRLGTSHDEAALSPQLERPEYGFDTPCTAGHDACCPFGIPEASWEYCNVQCGDDFEHRPCAVGWWFVCTGDEWRGAYAAHPADAILLAARELEGNDEKQG